MFGIGMQELVLVLLIALVVIGPRKLPEVARALGKGYAEFRRAFDDMKRSVETEVRTDEIRRTLLDLPPPAQPAPRKPPAPGEDPGPPPGPGAPGDPGDAGGPAAEGPPSGGRGGG